MNIQSDLFKRKNKNKTKRITEIPERIEPNGNVTKKKNADPGDPKTLNIRTIRKIKLLGNHFGIIAAIIIQISLTFIYRDWLSNKPKFWINLN